MVTHILMCCNTKGGTILGAPTEIVSLGQSELPYDLFLSYLEELSQNSFRFVYILSACVLYFPVNLVLATLKFIDYNVAMTFILNNNNKLCGQVAATICSRPSVTFDLLTMKSVWESCVTWGTPVQSFVFLGLLVFELEPMYATSDRRTDGRMTDADDRLMPPPPLRGRGHNNNNIAF